MLNKQKKLWKVYDLAVLNNLSTLFSYSNLTLRNLKSYLTNEEGTIELLLQLKNIKTKIFINIY